jgi:hypothetical protein
MGAAELSWGNEPTASVADQDKEVIARVAVQLLREAVPALVPTARAKQLLPSDRAVAVAVLTSIRASEPFMSATRSWSRLWKRGLKTG